MISQNATCFYGLGGNTCSSLLNSIRNPVELLKLPSLDEAIHTFNIHPDVLTASVS